MTYETQVLPGLSVSSCATASFHSAVFPPSCMYDKEKRILSLSEALLSRRKARLHAVRCWLSFAEVPSNFSCLPNLRIDVSGFAIGVVMVGCGLGGGGGGRGFGVWTMIGFCEVDVDGRGGKVGGAIDVRSWLNSSDAWES